MNKWIDFLSILFDFFICLIKLQTKLHEIPEDSLSVALVA